MVMSARNYVKKLTKLDTEDKMLQVAEQKTLKRINLLNIIIYVIKIMPAYNDHFPSRMPHK